MQLSPVSLPMMYSSRMCGGFVHKLRVSWVINFMLCSSTSPTLFQIFRACTTKRIAVFGIWIIPKRIGNIWYLDHSSSLTVVLHPNTATAKIKYTATNRGFRNRRQHTAVQDLHYWSDTKLRSRNRSQWDLHPRRI